MRPQSQPEFSDFPYEPSCDRMSDADLVKFLAGLHGLNRLRAIKDRNSARALFELYLGMGWHRNDVFRPKLVAPSGENEERYP